jgi:hypothetical protein
LDTLLGYSPTAVFWFLCEHCPPWNCNGWHWSVWQGHCRTLWSVDESPKDSSHSELLGFWTLSIIQYSRNYKTQHFGNWICFHPQVREDTYSVESLRKS